ncbi:MAG: hypothetical protein PHP74_04750 [Candidatus Gracilibacteria bacterium]|nr:hypothetical protein [Candidatus Gracilibacteria bacterium]
MVKTRHFKKDGIIDLREASNSKEADIHEEEDPEFQISSMDDEAEMEVHRMKASPVHDAEIAEMKTAEKVKVKFDKFATLVATRATPEMVEQCRDEDVIVSTNLLTDLANSGTPEDSGKKIPMIFLIGIVLGIGLTYILLKY